MLYWFSLVLSQLVAVSCSIRQSADYSPRLPNAAVEETRSGSEESQLEGGLGVPMEEWGKMDSLEHGGKDGLSADPQLRIELYRAEMEGDLISGVGYANSTDFVSLALQRPDLFVPELAADTKVLVELYGAKLVAEGIERGQMFPNRGKKEVEDFFEKAKSDFVALSYSKPDLFDPEIAQCIQHLAGVFGAAKVNKLMIECAKNPERIERSFGRVLGWKAKVLSRPKRTWGGLFAHMAINATIVVAFFSYASLSHSGRF